MASQVTTMAKVPHLFLTTNNVNPNSTSSLCQRHVRLPPIKTTTLTSTSSNNPSFPSKQRSTLAFLPSSLRSRNKISTFVTRASSLSQGFTSDEPESSLGGEDGGDIGGAGGRGGGGGGDGKSGDDSSNDPNARKDWWIFASLAKGWNDRVNADPQFVFKVLTEQIIGVSASVLGDMASRPNFGLNELDFVFSTLVVGSIVNFLLMYMLAPAGVSVKALPWIFSTCPAGHMFEKGAYSLAQRLGTFVYKGIQFSTVGFIAGIFGTVLSNSLLAVRKALQPDFVLQNISPPPVLNGITWTLHLGINSNVRYQCLNGLDGVLVNVFSPTLFRSYVFFIRGFNNIIGGSTFAMLAKLTGSQKPKPVEDLDDDIDLTFLK